MDSSPEALYGGGVLNLSASVGQQNDAGIDDPLPQYYVFESTIGDTNNNNNANIFFGVFVVLTGAFCFGTMHVPIRRFATGKDCFFVQWVMSFGSLMVGFAVNNAMGSPPMRLMASGGGILWTIANTIAQFVISRLGLAPALLLWSTTNILTGWSTGRFGLFGLKQKVPEHEVLNVLGLITILTGGFCFAFIKKSYPRMRNTHSATGLFEAEDGTGKGDPDEEEPEEKPRRNSLLAVTRMVVPEGKLDKKKISLEMPAAVVDGIQLRAWLMRGSRRTICICMTLVSGFFYSATVIPVIYIQDHPELFPDAPHSGLNYIFSHYFGIFLGSTTIFIIYAIIQNNKPTVNPSVILPALASGAIWGCGMVCLFLSNDLLTQTVTYPVLITIPGCVASLWSICYFKEIELTRQNSAIIAISFLLIFCGALMSFISKSKLRLGQMLPFAKFD